MKNLIMVVMAVVAVHLCKSQQPVNKAVEDQQKAYAALRPGTIPVNAGGWTMTAVVGGKPWTAASMMPPEASDRIIGYFHEEYIGLPFDRRYLVVGKKIEFGEHNATDLSVGDDNETWAGRTGEMEITKVAGGWAEGKFYFTANSRHSAKVIPVTNGFFRIALPKR